MCVLGGVGNPLHKQEPNEVSAVVSTIFLCSPSIDLENIWVWIYEVVSFRGKERTVFVSVPWSVRRQHLNFSPGSGNQQCYQLPHPHYVHSAGPCAIPSTCHQPQEGLETQTWENGRKHLTHENRGCGHLWVRSWGKEVWLGSHQQPASGQLIVNQWSLAPIQCQHESPVWGVVKKETLFSANSSVVIQFTWVLWYSIAAKQHNWECGCEAVLGQSGPWARPFWLDSSALLCSVPARRFWCYSSSQGNAVFNLWKEKVCSSSQRTADLYREVPIPGPWLVSPHANKDSKSLQFGPKSTVLIGQNGATLIGQWRC